MARNNTKKPKKDTKKIQRKGGFVKRILKFAIIYGMIIAAVISLRNSHYFKVKGVEVLDRNSATRLKGYDLLRTYKDRNIFDIDIKSLAARIKKDYPTVKDAVVRKVLPDKLEIDIVPRVPVAKIKVHGYFPVDRSGMILSPEIKCGKMPIITGFPIWVRPNVGERLKNRELENVFLLIDALKEGAIGMDYDVAAIDMSNQRNISFYLESGLEVRIGEEDFPARLKRLKETLANPSVNKKNVKYIDLRFKDIVIGPK